jgi:hypothetical protein
LAILWPTPHSGGETIAFSSELGCSARNKSRTRQSGPRFIWRLLDSRDRSKTALIERWLGVSAILIRRQPNRSGRHPGRRHSRCGQDALAIGRALCGGPEAVPGTLLKDFLIGRIQPIDRKEHIGDHAIEPMRANCTHVLSARWLAQCVRRVDHRECDKDQATLRPDHGGSRRFARKS